MQIKNTLRFHLIPATIKNITNNKCWGECRKKEPSYPADRNVS
jgi:hypothetical protein